MIGEGVKLDNLIQIGHNVQIGAHTAIAGCTGVSGSTRIGARCMIGGGVGIAGHIEICDDVVIAGRRWCPARSAQPGVYASLWSGRAAAALEAHRGATEAAARSAKLRASPQQSRTHRKADDE